MTLIPESGLFSVLFAVLMGYCVGSVPTAYLAVKRKAKIDIRSAGTGNVGGMNTYDVTGSVPLAVLVVAVDCGKGIAAVLLGSLLTGGDPVAAGSAGVAAVAGHTYSPWIGFHGGRGLATAAGVLLVIGWFVVVIWLAAWAIGYGYSRNIHLANGIATICGPVVLAFMPGRMESSLLTAGFSPARLMLVVLMLSSIIIIRHIRPFRELLQSHHNRSTSS